MLCQTGALFSGSPGIRNFSTFMTFCDNELHEDHFYFWYPIYESCVKGGLRASKIYQGCG